MHERIKTVRKTFDLTQAEFADRIKASRDKIASYETGRVIPPDTTLNLISKEFGVSYAWLKTGEGPMEDPIADEASLDRLTETYHSLPDRLRNLVDALCKMDPEWYRTLDDALAEIDRRKSERGAE